MLPGYAQLVGDLDGDGVDDLMVAAKCTNPMADRDEYGFVVADPFDTFHGVWGCQGDVQLSRQMFRSDEAVTLLIVHGAEKDGWQAEKPKAKFLLINLPFKTLSVKRYSVKKRTVLGIYMEEQGPGREHVFRGVLGWKEISLRATGLYYGVGAL